MHFDVFVFVFQHFYIFVSVLHSFWSLHVYIVLFWLISSRAVQIFHHSSIFFFACCVSFFFSIAQRTMSGLISWKCSADTTLPTSTASFFFLTFVFVRQTISNVISFCSFKIYKKKRRRRRTKLQQQQTTHTILQTRKFSSRGDVRMLRVSTVRCFEVQPGSSVQVGKSKQKTKKKKNKKNKTTTTTNNINNSTNQEAQYKRGYQNAQSHYSQKLWSPNRAKKQNRRNVGICGWKWQLHKLT